MNYSFLLACGCGNSGSGAGSNCGPNQSALASASQCPNDRSEYCSTSDQLGGSSILANTSMAPHCCDIRCAGCPSQDDRAGIFVPAKYLYFKRIYCNLPSGRGIFLAQLPKLGKGLT